MENLGEQTVQLRERHWKIFASDGFLETVRGRGVVGQEPVLSTRQPAFQGRQLALKTSDYLIIYADFDIPGSKMNLQ